MGADWSRTPALAVAVALALALPAVAQAGVNAETVLPPGQSGFVPPAGQPDNPHLLDQLPLFESLRVQARRLRPARGDDRIAPRRRDDHP